MSEQNDPADPITEAIVALLPALLNALETLGFIARHLHPPQLAVLMASCGDRQQPLRAALPGFRQVDWPENLTRFRQQVEAAAEATLEAYDGLAAAASEADGRLSAYRALRLAPRAMEALYPLAGLLPAVSRFFLEPAARGDQALIDRLAAVKPGHEGVGLFHASNERQMHGGFSLYVPETYTPERQHPVVVALHGGSGHGRAFLWSWLREARSRGLILLSPTAIGGTWSLMDPEIDSDNIERMLEHVRQNWSVDPKRLLLTGMSDGGTFSLMSGLRSASPFTHLAPIAASFHPLLMSLSTPERIGGLPIHLTHGALDWMFPVAMAQHSQAALSAAGANVTYREIADLSHTYPRDENGGILDWFLA